MFDVIVIGGGIGGLCLAQGLAGAGIPVRVYERDAAQFRDQGYRITIKAEGAAALLACLPPDRYDLALRTAIRSATRMAFFDEQLQGFAAVSALLHQPFGPRPLIDQRNRK